MTDWFEVAKDICSSPSGRSPGPMPPPPNAHEPDTVAEEQIAELRRERDRYREALQAIYDHDDGAWAAGEYAEEARRVGISTVRGIAARALAPVAP